LPQTSFVAPSDVHVYLSRVSARLCAILDGELLGVYAGGSIGFAAYVPGRSDIDVAAVSRGPLELQQKQAIVAELRHEALPCPARGLELVVYSERVVGEPLPEPGFELELNTGAEMPLHVAFDPSAANGWHWYVIDRAILARHGVTLIGPRASTLVADVPRELVLPALRESLRWHTGEVARPDDAVLNACRALRYAVEGTWSSKPDAGRWALGRVDDADLVTDALLARAETQELGAARVTAFLVHTAEQLEL
jgi:Aminoglycoside adenylyltransferase, C-terminal domain